MALAETEKLLSDCSPQTLLALITLTQDCLRLCPEGAPCVYRRSCTSCGNGCKSGVDEELRL